METDLFSSRLTTKTPEETRRTPEKDFRGSQIPKVEPRNPGSRESRGRTPETPGDLPGNRVRLQDLGTRRRTPNLLEERKRLENEVEQAEAEFARANNVQEPYRAAFNAAHERLVMLHDTRRSGRSISKPLMLGAYDARMIAGHEWHPFRSRANDLGQWLKRLREDLRAVNKEIGT